jgi:AcrR family transcriptional regulator
VPKRTGLTTRAVARAALELLDDEGLDAVTMRRVAAALDVSPMTLYSYVADHDALLDEAAQLLYAGIAAPEPGLPPRESLRALMHNVRRTLLAHPGALPLVSTYPPRTLEALAFVDAGYRALRGAGVPALDVVSAYRALAAYSLGTATVELHRYFAGAPARGALPDPVTLKRERPYVAELSPLLEHLDDDAEFDYGLDLTLDGFLARYLPG